MGRKEAIQDIDVRKELEKFHWVNARWTSNKLIAASPFRLDRHPSFFVWLVDNPATGARAGDWVDSGATDPRWAKGNIVKLLAFMRGETEEETREYLRWMYSDDFRGDEDDLHLDVRLSDEKRPRYLDSAILNQYKFRHPYLTRRGISEKVQRVMCIGYDRKSKAITMPWFMPDGRLAALKYRSVSSKAFWYARGGQPIRKCVYGINVVYRIRAKTVVLTEAEIDAMSAMTAGYPAIAVGSANISPEQAEQIIRSPVERVIVASDNDDAGKELFRKVVSYLNGVVEIFAVEWGNYKTKDLNEFLVCYGEQETRKFIEKSVRV